MERKPIETEDTFTGEEFLEESDFSDEEVIIEEASAKQKDKKKFKTKRTEAEKKEMEDEEEGWIEIKEPQTERKEEIKKEEITQKWEEPAKAPLADPWKQEAQEENVSGTAWKVMTGILLVLLIISVLTFGFRFGMKSPTGGSVVSLAQAENTALSYVNTNLLQPPFLATVEKSEDAGNLYKVTLSVAGQSIDSFITKDGKLFFPQGFDTSMSLEEQAGQEKDIVPSETEINMPVPGEDPVQEIIVEEAPIEETLTETSFTITAKKWLFTPNKITVPYGEKITFTIQPKDLDKFTFSIPAFTVEEDVDGITTIIFTADKKGKFPFLCSSCEEFRGMTGTLVVE